MIKVTVKQRILALLGEGKPMLSMAISDKLGISKAAASETTKELHRAGKIHVAEWRNNKKNGGNKVYAIGKGKDAVKAIRAIKDDMPFVHTIHDVQSDSSAKVIKAPFKPHADVASAWLRNPI